MTVALVTLQEIGIFLAGAVVRVGIVLGVLAVLVLPVVAIAWGINQLRERRRRALGLHEVQGVTVRSGVRYAPGHLWLAPRGEGTLEVGIDDLALRLLPAVTAVEPVRAGTKVRRGEPIATLWGGGRQLPLHAPFDCRVAGANGAVVGNPGLVRTDGYGRGWLVALEPANEEWSALPADADADRWMADEAHRWNVMIERQMGIAAADGGELLSPAPWLLGEERWNDLVAAFTRPD